MSGSTPVEGPGGFGSQYDVAVIGGGIYGAAAAWEAVSRGLSVVLMEAGDFGSGTSSNSLKTIHGGLRSLQRLDFPEMREYIRERRALLRIAPHLVSPMQCVIPTSPKLSKSRLFLGAGMMLYDIISWDRNRGLAPERRIPATRLVSPEAVRQKASGLEAADLTGGAHWYDAQVYNSERLVLAFVMSAVQAGADARNYLLKTGYISEKGVITGVEAVDQLTGAKTCIGARAVIDCTGPWALKEDAFIDSTRAAVRPDLAAYAVNLVVDTRLTEWAVGARPRSAESEGERLLFIAPWRRGSIVGTWYYSQSPGPKQAPLSDAELSRCLAQINSLFPAVKLTRANITQIHHGLQPAKSAKSDDAEPELWRHTRTLKAVRGSVTGGLFWVQGVKLTTARATAEQIVDKVAGYLGVTISPSKTSETPLYGGNLGSVSDFERVAASRLDRICSPEATTRLIRNYGTNFDAIIRLCEEDDSLARCVPGMDDTIKAEIRFVLENEMVRTLSDLILRRTDIGSFECPRMETIEYCADVMADFLGWDSAQRSENVSELVRSYPVWCCANGD